MPRLTLAAILILLSASSRVWAGLNSAPAAASRDPRETYFNQGWAEASGETTAPAAPAAEEAESTAPARPGDGPVLHPEHEQVTHMFLTRLAFEMFKAQNPGTELGLYIGDYQGDKPSTHNHDNVIEGAYQEDEARENPFNEGFPSSRHFWDWRRGLYAGIYGFDSGVDRAYKYLSGGYGIEGRYDPAWSNNSGKLKGVKGQGAIYLYRHGQKAKAYWYLGHIAHLLEDLTVPAHVHLWPHVVKNMDRFETYMGTQHQRWSEIPSGPIETFADLHELFLKTAQESEKFDCGFGAGLAGMNGSADRGRRRQGGFSDAELDQEGDVLMPLAVKRAAALFQYFYQAVEAPEKP